MTSRTFIARDAYVVDGDVAWKCRAANATKSDLWARTPQNMDAIVINLFIVDIKIDYP